MRRLLNRFALFFRTFADNSFDLRASGFGWRSALGLKGYKARDVERYKEAIDQAM